MEDGAFTRLGVLMACSPRLARGCRGPSAPTVKQAGHSAGARKRAAESGFCESSSKEIIEHPTYENNDHDDLSFARAFGGEYVIV